ncbi:MAG: tRNA (guanosine(37)-N1)-methyltransferase TrmD [Chloroflexi bacterium]|nr:tRNA (guanosine(37)-N1)-methyltransferase TrmD [Chloroflexota bacterium]
MRVDILTLFPEMFQGPFDASIIKRAIERGVISVHLHNIRDWAFDKHHVTDDYTFGGGPGMLMKPEPLFAATEAVLAMAEPSERGEVPVVLMTPQGRRFTQQVADEFARHPRLVLLCGHYEGVDERVRRHLATDEISIGDYVLTGGELPAMVVTDTLARRIPGVLGSSASSHDESIASGLLEYPQWTRPAEFRGWTVPDMLLSGNHGAVDRWRREQALMRTALRRPDLLPTAPLTPADLKFLRQKYGAGGLARLLAGTPAEPLTNAEDSAVR